MKKIILILSLVFVTNLYSQSIETDPLFIEYENEYFNGAVKKLDFDAYEMDLKKFNASFVDIKAIKNYNKSKDKLRWFEKNIDKTKFVSLSEALNLYNKIQDFNTQHTSASTKINELRIALEKKYDGKEIFYTMKKRLEQKQ